MTIEPGLTGTAQLTVAATHTATAVGSGDVPVLATPVVVALCEEATVAALSGHLAASETSVGTRVEVDHLAASAVGAAVRANAVVSQVDGRKIVFAVMVEEAGSEVATGVIRRVIVDRDRFLGSVAKP